ncbi:MAG: methyltransferase domain-containing protein [Methanoregula sp.]|nr:methyltransferase domain-containing protein [Methanoregula sp.]
MRPSPEPADPVPPFGKTGFFSGKAGYYARYRKGYPGEVFDAIIAGFDLTPTSEILDLGCGTGNVAIPLAERGFRVHAVDPDPGMLAEAQRCYRIPGASRICWYTGADSTIATLGLPPLRLCTMGLSFHWMDREAVLRTLDGMIELGGGIACVSRNDSFFSHLDNRWGDAVRDVLREMLGDGWDYSGRLKKRQEICHEDVFRMSPFPVIEEHTFTVLAILTIDDIIGLQLSTSYAAPELLADRHDEFRTRLTRRLLDLEPSGQFTEESRIHLILAKRS